ncbi:SDR family oxidoreductase [Aspergillus novofumigatus IBT 16806]|uniref:NAD dependent epimerase/dehydratase family protein n=1 Tax=Aspergillus novofumigatus (strain IBT 16806) TaxID=1392255 RepID=A0A2I1CH61_ASPN1|nr:NAD dependent epimerase/dehydratase family protein [Aspergillus novofumigatus IBT 16806]PKX96930.1 NAD dependent epimerase/dehydratase family protein [Aspergillus novofumigatus IBT 16806]
MPSAIVTGATGITGSAIVHHLCKDPEYEKVVSLSRSNPGYRSPKVRHHMLDLQASAAEMAENLRDISADYVFFCAYLARDDPVELSRVNGLMLSNFLQALEITGATKTLKRFILTCGFKHYGVHLGHCKQPLIEDDALLEESQGGGSWPPIFYYEQERILKDAAIRGQWEWVVTLPEDVLGYARGNFMNEATGLGLYCAVSKALPGSELPFPGCKANYFAFNCWTSANLHARFGLWAATAPGAGNNMFNVMNGDTESFQNLWPRLAKRFGCKIPSPMFPHGGTPDTQGYGKYEATTVRLQNRHPLAAHSQELGVSADGIPTLFLQVDPEKWAKRKDVNDAWAKLRDQYNLDQQAWEKATWDFLTFVLGRDWSCVGTMSKARRLGWTGYADTWDELEETFETLEREGVLPPVEKLKREFN